MRSILIGAAMAVAAAGPVMAQGAPQSEGPQSSGTILLVPAQGGGIPVAVPSMGQGQMNQAQMGQAQMGQAQAGQAQRGQTPAQPGMAGGAAMGGQSGGASPQAMMAEHMRHMQWMRARLGGSSFRFRHGQNEIDIHCSGAEPVAVCAAAAGALLDKIGSMQAPAGAAQGAAQGGGQAMPGGGAQGGGTQGGGAQGGGASGSGAPQH